MAKLDLGIIGVLALGVGAFALLKTGILGKITLPKPDITKTPNFPVQLTSESCQQFRNRVQTLGWQVDWNTQCQNEPLQPTAIIPTDNGQTVTIASGETAVFAGVNTPVILPTQIQSQTPSVSTPIPVEDTQQVIEDIFDGNLDPSSQDVIVTQATKVFISDITLFGFIGQLDIGENIKFFGNVNTGVGVLTYDWDFGDNVISSGTNKQYTNHTYSKEGQYIVTLKVTSNYGASATKTKTINIIPNPVKQGDVTSKVLPQPNSALIRLTNNHTNGITGSFTVNITGANTKRFSSTTHINGKQSAEIIIDGLNSGYSKFSIDFKPNGSSKDIVIDDNQTIFIYDLIVEAIPNAPAVVDNSCKLSSEVQAILFQLDTVLKSPTWFMTGNVKDVRECNLDERIFINSYNSLLLQGIITVK